MWRGDSTSQYPIRQAMKLKHVSKMFLDKLQSFVTRSVWSHEQSVFHRCILLAVFCCALLPIICYSRNSVNYIYLRVIMTFSKATMRLAKWYFHFGRLNFLIRKYTLFYKQHFFKQRQAEIGKKLSKS